MTPESSQTEVQKFVGALAGQRAKKGVFITRQVFLKKRLLRFANGIQNCFDRRRTISAIYDDYNPGVSIQNAYK